MAVTDPIFTTSHQVNNFL